MVTEKDLKEDYENILKSGELRRPEKSQRISLTVQGLVWLVVLFLSVWTVAWLYNWLY